MCSVSARAVSKVRTSTRPSPSSCSTGSGLRKARNSVGSMAPLVGIAAETDWDAASSREPNLRVTRSATVGALPPERVRNASGKSRMPRTSAPRKA